MLKPVPTDDDADILVEILLYLATIDASLLAHGLYFSQLIWPE